MYLLLLNLQDFTTIYIYTEVFTKKVANFTAKNACNIAQCGFNNLVSLPDNGVLVYTLVLKIVLK